MKVNKTAANFDTFLWDDLDELSHLDKIYIYVWEEIEIINLIISS